MNNNFEKYTKIPKGKNQYLDQYINAIRKTISNSKSTSLKLNNKSKKSNPFAKNVVGLYNYGGLKYKFPKNTKMNAKWMSPFIKKSKTSSRKKFSLEDMDSFPLIETRSKSRRK